jgi:tetratricopeptide (TPR) repeat protein
MRKISLALASLLLPVSLLAQWTGEMVQAYEEENYESAIRLAKQAIRQDMANGTNYYWLGNSFHRLGKMDSAAMAFAKGKSMDEKNILNYGGLAMMWLDKGKISEAMDELSEARSYTSAKDMNYYIMSARANIYSTKPNAQEAITILNKAIEYNNKVAEIHFLFGEAYILLNNGGEAVNSYERAVSFDATMAKAYAGIGNIWSLAKNYSQALQAYQRGLQIDSTFAPLLRGLADLYLYTGQFEKGTQTFQKYYSMADKNNDLEFRYAQFLFLGKRYAESVDKLQSIIDNGYEKPIAHRLLGYSFYELQKYNESLAQLDEFFSKTEAEKYLASDFEYYGKALIRNNQPEKGMAEIQKAISMDTSLYALYNEIALVYYQSKDYNRAAETYQMKINAAPSKAGIQDYFNVGKSFYFGRSFLRADSAFIGMINLNKNWPIGYLWRARVYTNLEDTANVLGLASPYYQQVIEKAISDTVKYSVELKEAYKYLGDINAFKEQYGSALFFYQRYLGLDPGNNDVQKMIKTLNDLYKTGTVNTLPLQKENDRFVIPVTINTIQYNFVYDASIQGIAVTPEKMQELALLDGGVSAIAEQLSISNRSIKNAKVDTIAGLPFQFAIGPDALNRFNIVFDYSSGSLLLR